MIPEYNPFSLVSTLFHNSQGPINNAILQTASAYNMFGVSLNRGVSTNILGSIVNQNSQACLLAPSQHTLRKGRSLTLSFAGTTIP